MPKKIPHLSRGNRIACGLFARRQLQILQVHRAILLCKYLQSLGGVAREFSDAVNQAFYVALLMLNMDASRGMTTSPSRGESGNSLCVLSWRSMLCSSFMPFR